MSNLRDRGYPQSRTERVNRTNRRNALMTNSVSAPSYSGMAELGTSPVQKTTMLDRLVNTYNNRAYGNPKAPLISRLGVDYVDDINDERAYENSYALRNRNGNRYGFVDKDVNSVGTTYSAGVDNLSPLLGQNYYNRNFNTPLGNVGFEYDGDGTLVGTLNVPSNAYYIAALKNLLDRGTL